VHRPCSSCISSVEKSNENSIEFSLSNVDKGAVGLIPALELASLTSGLWMTEHESFHGPRIYTFVQRTICFE